MKPAYKRIRVVALLGLLVMTTTMAASPVREAMLPLLSRPLARLNLITAPAPVVVGDVARTAPARVSDVGLTPLSPPEYVAERSTISTANPFTAQTALAPRAGALAQTWADETLAAALIAESRASRFDVGPWQSGAASSPARAGSASLRRSRGLGVGRAQRRDARNQFSGEGDKRDGQGASKAKGSPTASAGTSSAGSASAGKSPTDPSRVLTEHTQGVTDLNGSNGVSQAATLPLGGLANVASTPEPSTLLLFGTGILAAGGALRRRMRPAR